MSTPSKKRRKARAWMQQEVARRASVEHSFAHYRRDVQALYASEERFRYDGRESRVVSTIPFFPDPRGDGPVARYVMPFLPAPRFDRLESQARFGRSTDIRFRAVEYAIDHVVGDARSTLRWFQWEPETGTPELEARTRVFRESLGKLSRSRHELELATIQHSGDLRGMGIVSLLTGTTSAVEAVIDDLRRILGRFSIDGGAQTEREERASW